MEISAKAVLARIYIDGNVMYGDRHLAEVVVERARAFGLSGATVLRGLSGFGQSHRTHGSGGFDLSENNPVVVEIVDEEARLRPFARSLDDIKISLFTLERVEVLRPLALRTEPRGA